MTLLLDIPAYARAEAITVSAAKKRIERKQLQPLRPAGRRGRRLIRLEDVRSPRAIREISQAAQALGAPEDAVVIVHVGNPWDFEIVGL